MNKENKMEIEAILKQALVMNASDIFVIAGYHVAYKINGKIQPQSKIVLTPEMTYDFCKAIFEKRYGSKSPFKFDYELDFSFSLSKIARFRVNLFYQRGSLAAVLRVVKYSLPDAQKLLIPQPIIDLAKVENGLVIVSGSAGSGKSTTLACIIDKINQTQTKHIITIEDPIEFLFSHNQSIVSQKEIGSDAQSYASALKGALREAPDVILVGEMRDLETISTALTAVETGHTVYSTLHTNGAIETINRIIDVFPSEQQHQIEVQLSSALKVVISQRLINNVDDKLIPVFEVLVVNQAIRTLIREHKTHQIANYLANGDNHGILSLDDSLIKLYQEKVIDKKTALLNAHNKTLMKAKLK